MSMQSGNVNSMGKKVMVDKPLGATWRVARRIEISNMYEFLIQLMKVTILKDSLGCHVLGAESLT